MLAFLLVKRGTLGHSHRHGARVAEVSDVALLLGRAGSGRGGSWQLRVLLEERPLPRLRGFGRVQCGGGGAAQIV